MKTFTSANNNTNTLSLGNFSDKHKFSNFANSGFLAFLYYTAFPDFPDRRDRKPRCRVYSASPASVDKLHGLHRQGSSYNVICIVSSYSYNHQPVQLAHDEDQVILRKGCGQASWEGFDRTKNPAPHTGSKKWLYFSTRSDGRDHVS